MVKLANLLEENLNNSNVKLIFKDYVKRLMLKL